MKMLIPDQFHRRIRSALANQPLQAALDANANRRMIANQQAFVSLGEDLQVLRQRAHQCRKKTIENLDFFLEQFITQVKGNGIIVHRAGNAQQAVQYVLNIAQDNQAKLIAKSKTMVSEEIGLNPVLEATGIRVIETDLGEFIVQLRGERPSHIITPAVHLRRAEVGQTFHEKLNIPYSQDVPTLTAAARKVLRETFLTADIGISGVNFGVVESGTLCLVTNEGNGRMVTTLPKIHIALMGIERLVPTFDDLALMLSLLTRAATGQKITVYVSLINSPRGEKDPDGATQRHLILVDNGRDLMRKSPLAEALLCIRCGACLNACPVFREIGGHSYVSKTGEGSPYPGPIGSIISPVFFGGPEFGQLARASSLCGACREVCPVDIDLPKLLLRERAGGVKLESAQALQNIPGGVVLGLRLYTWFAKKPGRFALAEKAGYLLSRMFSPFSHWLWLPGFTGWGYSKDMPSLARRSFRKRWAEGEYRSSVDVTFTHDGFQNQEKGLDKIEEETKASEKSRNEPALPGSEDLVNRFSEELIALEGTLTYCYIDKDSKASSDELQRNIRAFLQDKGVKKIQAWESNQLPEKLVSSLQSSGINIVNEPDPEIRIGLTGALAGIAETGSLVIPSGPGRPLTASLLPEIHLAVLRASDIYENLAQVLKLPDIRESASAVVISGPSRTGDIEMTHTIGVHGPMELHVFCLLCR